MPLSAPVRIFFIDLHQDDPRKATMRKLERFGFAKKISPRGALNGLVLTPHAHDFLLTDDLYIASGGGIVLLEGSWKRSNTLDKFRFRHGRKLPLLMPVNPVNYGKPGLLSSVEALGAALFILGMEDYSVTVLEKFSWGIGFLDANREPLTEYSKCRDNESVLAVQQDFFNQI